MEEHGQDDLAVAVVAMAGRFPGAADIPAFWAALCAGTEAGRRHSREELIAGGVPEPTVTDPRFVPVSAPVDGPYDFPADFFRMSPEAARGTDPQHRLFLECAWQALEAAGLLAGPGPRHVGVFAGASEGTYLPLVGGNSGDGLEQLALDLGNSQDFLATRVAHTLDLRGPALSVRTACSTSLVAVHLAVQSLLAGECEAAVAGGSAVRHPLRRGHVHEAGGIYSRDGRCRPYDEEASGIFSGDGVGAVVLKPLASALADGDHIHAVVRGSAVNNDGGDKSGFTAPGLRGQAAVARAALEVAGVDPRTIGYLEGHGTGTPLGDPIEVKALTRAWRTRTADRGYCSLGSVKANIGHLDAAAGVAGFIKACLAVEHGILPGLPSFTRPNPELSLADSPFVLHRQTRPWPAQDRPRRAAVHSLGLGGTNAHVIIEQAPARTATAGTGPLILPLSAPDGGSLSHYARALADTLDGTESGAAAAATLREGRTAYSSRRVVVATDTVDAVRALRVPLEPRPSAGDPSTVFMFPGGGAHRAGMARDLDTTLPAFRAALDALDPLVRRVTGHALRALLWGAEQEYLARPTHGFPATVAVSLAMAQTLGSFGVSPDSVLGYSLGELPAAAVAGVFEPEDALRVAALRGRIFERMPAGGSLHVAAAPAWVEREAPPGVLVAVRNGDEDCVVSGPLEPLRRFEERLAERGVDHRRIAVPGAVHSPLLDPFLAEYAQAIAETAPRPPRVPLLSNVTGTRLTDEEAQDPAYWAQQLRQVVRFDDCLRTAARDGAVLVDLGPGRGLEAIARGIPRSADRWTVTAAMPSGRDPRSETVVLAHCLGTLWERGVPVDWTAAPGGRVRRLALPIALPARSTYAPESPAPARPGPTAATTATAPALWSRSWRRLESAPAQRRQDGALVVLLAPDAGTARPYAAAADDAGIESRAVTRASDALREIRRAAPGGPPPAVVDLRPLAGGTALDFLELAAGTGEARARLYAVGERMFDVLGTETIDPSSAMLPAAVAVAAHERPELTVCCVDVTAADAPGTAVVAALSHPELHGQYAVRGRHLWTPFMERRQEPSHSRSLAVLRPGGVYLITGGLGRYGRWLAECLARESRATLLLAQRGRLPDRSLWDTGDLDDETGRRIAAVRRIEALGGTVELLTVDVTDEPAFATALAAAESRHGPVTGVIHAAADLNAPSGFAALDELRARGFSRGFAEQAAAKLDGTRVLDRVLGDRDLDFRVLMSSNAGVLGGPGLGLYAPVNAYLDAFARRGDGDGGRGWLSVGWDGWRLPEDPREAGARSSLEQYALSGEEAFAALLQAVRCGLPAVSVSRGDFQERFAAWVLRPSACPTAPPAAAQDTLEAPDKRPAPRDASALVREIWQELLGTPDLAGDEDLFAMGGTSLTAMRIRTRLRRHFGVDVPVADLIRNRTVNGMARLLEEGRADGRPAYAPAGAGEAGPATVDGSLGTDIFTLLDEIETATAGGKGEPR
ncbi:beta-ketoacyl synthase N-terminal-like domain-containing protein [Streptomyces eurythermus]